VKISPVLISKFNPALFTLHKVLIQRNENCLLIFVNRCGFFYAFFTSEFPIDRHFYVKKVGQVNELVSDECKRKLSSLIELYRKKKSA